MLQQTQVDRVIPYYWAFIKKYPTPRVLARASLTEVLSAWQGLGYNRRALRLRNAAQILSDRYKGRFPRTLEEIQSLPGVGRYTARAVGAFAFNTPAILIETNIRTVFLHHCFPRRGKAVPDSKIEARVAEALNSSGMRPRTFYAALMDYGSSLKRSGVKLNAQSAQYKKQPAFKGSSRELRGAIIRLLLDRPYKGEMLARKCKRPLFEVDAVLTKLKKEGLVEERKKMFSLSR
ncbi:MAG: A/G-specific adenine glycosylase [Patescibacteria group bacterium]|nr:A/G-specific adenine glycosylase [Patescibacteria group bacterium]